MLGKEEKKDLAAEWILEEEEAGWMWWSLKDEKRKLFTAS